MNISGAATKTLWLLIRFRDKGASTSKLLQLWQQKGRSILEFASPVFFSKLTQLQSKQIEDCQRKAIAVILQSHYISYEHSLKVLSQEKLPERRIKAAIKFGEKCVANPRHSDMFPRNLPVKEKRTSQKPFKEYFCRTDMLYFSSLPTSARLMNKKHLSEK